MLRAANLSLLILFPVAWFAPLMRAGFLPIFGMTEISVVTGLRALWDSDRVLAVIVGALAILAPIAKTAALACVQFGKLGPKTLGLVQWTGRLAMADVFLIAIYIVLAKTVGVGRLETAWGLYLFTGCVVASLVISHLSTPTHDE